MTTNNVDFTDVPIMDTELSYLAVRWMNQAAGLDIEGHRILQRQQNEDTLTNYDIKLFEAIVLRQASNLVIGGMTRYEIAEHATDQMADAYHNSPSTNRTATVATWHRILNDLEEEPKRNACNRMIDEIRRANENANNAPKTPWQAIRMILTPRSSK